MVESVTEDYLHNQWGNLKNTDFHCYAYFHLIRGHKQNTTNLFLTHHYWSNDQSESQNIWMWEEGMGGEAFPNGKLEENRNHIEKRKWWIPEKEEKSRKNYNKKHSIKFTQDNEEEHKKELKKHSYMPILMWQWRRSPTLSVLSNCRLTTKKTTTTYFEHERNKENWKTRTTKWLSTSHDTV